MTKNMFFGLIIFGVFCNVYALPRVSLVTFNLANVMLKSSYLMQDNPARTAKCFQEYSPKLINLTDQYEQDYNDCLNNTAEAESALEHQFQGDIDFVQNSSKTISLSFDNCSTTVESLYDLFQCYYNAAGFTIQSANEVQNLASNKMKFIQIREEYISYNQTVCTDDCFQSYNTESLKIHTELEQCLAGINQVTSTTEAATTTTEEAETTKEPETTQASETTTTSSEKKDTTTIIPAETF